MTRSDYLIILERLKRIELTNKKVWKAKHYRWANTIWYEIQYIRQLIENEIGSIERQE